jgi:hypothetical protein
LWPGEVGDSGRFALSGYTPAFGREESLRDGVLFRGLKMLLNISRRLSFHGAKEVLSGAEAVFREATGAQETGWQVISPRAICDEQWDASKDR